MKNLLFALILLATVVSCACPKRCIQPTETNTTTLVKDSIVLRDSVVLVPSTQSSATYTIVCDSASKAVKLVPRTKTAGQHLAAPTARIVGNTLQVDCATEAHAIFLRWKEKYLTNTKHTMKTIHVEVEKRLTWHQRIALPIGYLAIVAGIVLLIGRIAYKFLKK